MLDAAIADALRATSTGTISTILLKKGIRRTWMRGPRPAFAADERIVGPAFPLRFVPAREDLATPASWSSPTSTRAAIEAMPDGAVAVVDAMGITDAGIFGDILCARMRKRGVQALVTDGAVRDGAGVEATGLPVWCAGVAAPASVAALTFVGWGDPIGCGGIAVYPDDVVVADRDGVVVVPKAFVEEVAKAGPDQELLELWIMKEVERGVPLPGLYPPDADAMARFDADRRRGDD